MELQDKLNACGEWHVHACEHTCLQITFSPSPGGASPLKMSRRCPADRAGGSNAALPRDEDRDSFAAIVSSCGQRGEAEDLLANIIGAA